jgi:outer membrane protein TolC
MARSSHVLFAALILAAIAPSGFGLMRAADAGPATAAPSVANLPLSLDDCRRLALAHNLDLRAQRETLAAAGFLRAAELGAFEPDFVASVSREYNQRLNTVEQTISQGTTVFQEKNTLYSTGIEGLSPTGATYNIGYSVHDLNNNLRVLPTDPLLRQFQTFLGVTVSQPLLKDAGTASTYAKLRLAREDEKIARQDFRRQLLVVVGSVESVYWDLYVAQERLGLRLASVAAADKLLTENQERVHEGKMAEIELVEAQAGLAQRRSAASEAQQHLIEVSGRLRTLFAEPVDQPNWVLHASDAPPPPAPPPAIDEALRDSVMLHPEYLTRFHKAEQEKIRIAYARNQRWPQVDLKASYGQNGLGSTDGGSWADLDHHYHESWSVGLEVRIPVLGGTRQANTLHAAQAHGREALLNLKAAEVEIANNIVTAERKVESLKAVATNYDDVAQAGQRLLKNEQSRLGEGKTDSRRLLEVENQFSDAQVAALESRGEYEKARVEFEMACGRLLKLRGVDLVEEPQRTSYWRQVMAGLGGIQTGSGQVHASEAPDPVKESESDQASEGRKVLLGLLGVDAGKASDRAPDAR